ncbi:MAG TPA: AAA family ATPase [Patescibacteria group bacterium]|nr:AAA family ATPase [Patescibacteria group bacterium]
MRIGFVGAHRVGKTTLAEEVAGNLSNYDFKNEPYLELEEMDYLFSEIPTLDEYIEQFNYSVKQIENSGNDVIFDRCPVDILAYIYATGEANNLKAFYDEMQNAMSQIDMLIFVPIERPDVILCQESDLPSLRHEVNEILHDLIGDLNNEILEVNGTLENRTKQVLGKIYSVMV